MHSYYSIIKQMQYILMQSSECLFSTEAIDSTVYGTVYDYVTGRQSYELNCQLLRHVLQHGQVFFFLHHVLTY